MNALELFEWAKTNNVTLSILGVENSTIVTLKRWHVETYHEAGEVFCNYIIAQSQNDIIKEGLDAALVTLENQIKHKLNKTTNENTSTEHTE